MFRFATLAVAPVVFLGAPRTAFGADCMSGVYCSCPEGGCNMPNCGWQCSCAGRNCNMPSCGANCDCYGGGCQMPSCGWECNNPSSDAAPDSSSPSFPNEMTCNPATGGTSECTCLLGRCDMSACTRSCSCPAGGCRMSPDCTWCSCSGGGCENFAPSVSAASDVSTAASTNPDDYPNEMLCNPLQDGTSECTCLFGGCDMTECKFRCSCPTGNCLTNPNCVECDCGPNCAVASDDSGGEAPAPTPPTASPPASGGGGGSCDGCTDGGCTCEFPNGRGCDQTSCSGKVSVSCAMGGCDQSGIDAGTSLSCGGGGCDQAGSRAGSVSCGMGNCDQRGISATWSLSCGMGQCCRDGTETGGSKSCGMGGCDTSASSCVGNAPPPGSTMSAAYSNKPDAVATVLLVGFVAMFY